MPKKNPSGRTPPTVLKGPPAPEDSAHGGCQCGLVRFEIDFPAFWAWHDHSAASRRAHAAAYATYVGVWRSRFRLTAGAEALSRFTDDAAGTTRAFCSTCGTPVYFERSSSTRMLNIPRALFETRTGREPRYHIAIDERPDWAYDGETLTPLKGFPGVVWARPKRRKPAARAEVHGY